MTYQSVVEMARNQSLIQRVAAAAAAEGIENPVVWAQTNIWQIASRSDWAEAWDYASSTYTLDYNPDTGARPGVINDQMILTAVQALNPPSTTTT